MDPKTYAFEIARLYVLDSSLPDGVKTRILGWIRSQSLRLLATCTESFEEAYATSDICRQLLQIEAFFSKNPTFAEPAVCEKAARTTFEKAEEICSITNRRLEWYYLHQDRKPDMQLILRRIEAYIDFVLGDTETFLEELPRLVRLTAGATRSRSRREAQPFLKVTKKVECTPGAFKYLQSLSYFWGYGRLKPQYVVDNRIEVVPKSWKTFRTIACEPGGNLPLQLAFDTYCKRKLALVGIDLSDQTKNQRLAEEGSITGELATIDLRTASDTTATNAVAWCFSPSWYDFLSDVRSPLGKGVWGKYKYSKFSSMGNGTTFAIETLIFAACAKALGSKRFSVYGDDIIIEADLVPQLKRVLRFLGYRFNDQKSFWTGPFRESCGTNWFSGEDITPFYFRDVLKPGKSKTTWCHVVNGLVSICVPGGLLWRECLATVQREKLNLVPYNHDTRSGVFVDIHTARQAKLIKKHRGWERYRARKSTTQTRSTTDIRSYFLWCLDRTKVATRMPVYVSSRLRSILRDLSPEDRRLEIRRTGSFLVRSTVPDLQQKYLFGWVNYVPVAGPPPIQLYWWAEELMGLLGRGCSSAGGG